MKPIWFTLFGILAFLILATPASAACVVPKDDLLITKSTTLCPGTYNIPDKGQQGVLIVKGNGITLDCGGATLIGIPSSGVAIDITSTTNSKITNCNIQSYSKGIYVHGNNPNPPSDRITITNNKISKVDEGIVLSFASNSVVSNNQVSDTLRYASSGESGTVFYAILSSASGPNNQFTNNIITNSKAGAAIGVLGSRGVVVSNNKITNNRGGIHVTASKSITLQNNEISNSSFHGIEVGAGNRHGINSNILILGNKVNNSKARGISVYYTTTATISNNIACSNAWVDIFCNPYIPVSIKGHGNTATKVQCPTIVMTKAC